MRDTSSPNTSRSRQKDRGRVIAFLRRAAGDAGVRAAVFPFWLSRLSVITLLVLGSAVSHHISLSGDQTREVNLSFQQLNITNTLRSYCTGSDPGWYNGIAQFGYEKMPFSTTAQHNWAFFPLFPMTWRLVSLVTREYELTGIALAHVLFFLALVVVYKTIVAFGLDDAIARRTVFYLAIFPTSFFFSFPMSESLFLLLTAGSLCCAKTNRWWLAGLLAALASATRPTGILLWPALAIIYWQSFGRRWPRKEVLSLLLAPAGLLVFMLYLHRITGDALAFAHIQEAWGRRVGLFIWPLIDYLQHPWIAVSWDLRIMNFLAAAGALVCGLLLLKWRQWAFGYYVLASVIMTLSSLLLIAQARYAIVLFPIHLVLALAGRNHYWDIGIRTVFSGLLFLMTALYAANFSWLR